MPARLASSAIDSCACFFVPTKRICPPSPARSRMNAYASSTRVRVCCRSMMWMPFRSMKMKRRILGFQRRAWCPKWTPDSRSCFIVTTAMCVSLVPPPAILSTWEGRPAGVRSTELRARSEIKSRRSVRQRSAGPPRLALVREPDELGIERAHLHLAFGARFVELGEGDRHVAADDDRTPACLDDDHLRAGRVARRRDKPEPGQYLE